MNFDSYIVSGTKTAISLTSPPPYRIKGFGDFLKHIKGNKKGFTLAETLITLTIIGVVAALTIPTLMTQYQNQQFVVGLKKAYSTLSTAIQMVPITEGCSAGDYDCSDLFKSRGEGYKKVIDVSILAKQFNIVDYNYENENTNKNCVSLVSGLYSGSGVPCFTTADGMSFGSSNGFFVDVNGPKGPNKKGRDQFAFQPEITGESGVPVGTLIPAGSKKNTDFDFSYGYWKDNQNSCSSKSLTYGCTQRVLEEDAMKY